MKATNAALAKVVADLPQYNWGMDAPPLKPQGTQDEFLFLDRTHPNKAGYFDF